MSLSVPTDLLSRAESGDVDDAAANRQPDAIGADPMPTCRGHAVVTSARG